MMTNCQKKEPPVVFGQVSFSYITYTTAMANVNLRELKTGAFRLGVVYSENPVPTVKDNVVDDFFSDPLSFSVGVSGLNPGTNYYVRPFIESSEGLFYGETIAFQTLQPEWFTDPRDSQKYLVKTYGNTTWMVENLNYHVPGSRYYASDSIKYAREFGRLYTYNQALVACPPGWRLPTPNEWNELIKFCGPSSEKAMEAMIEPGKRLWAASGEFIRNNATGFTIKPSGALSVLNGNETFTEFGYNASFWGKSGNNETADVYTYTPHSSGHFIVKADVRVNISYYSVRCVKDK